MLVRIIGGHGGRAPSFNTTSYLIDGHLLLDAGSVASGLRIEEQSRIENILISHAHLDHISDLAFLCDNCFGLKDEPFHVHSVEIVKTAIQKHLMNDIIWPDFSKIPNKQNPTVDFNLVEEEKIVTLGEYKILPVKVNHPAGGMGFIIEKGDSTVVFTQDTGPTERIWELAHKIKNLKAIFTEVSFPNKLADIAKKSQHHTPASLEKEIEKMPKDVPLFVGHLKPNYQKELYEEVDKIRGVERITLLGSDDTSYVF